MLYQFNVLDSEVGKPRDESRWITNVLPNKALRVFACAKKRLDDIFARICNYRITLQELSEMVEKKNNVYKLIDANCVQEKSQAVIKILDIEFQECALFQRRVQYLTQICQHVEVPVTGMYTLCQT